MPILYIHGVATRSRDGFFELKPYLERLVAPAISDNPGKVLIDDLFWGDAGVNFAWDGLSRPRTRLLGQGVQATAVTPAQAALTAAAFQDALDRLPSPAPAVSVTGGLISGGATPTAPVRPKSRMADLSPRELSDLLALVIAQTVADPPQRARLVLAADAVAHDPTTVLALAGAATAQQELDRLLERVNERARTDVELVGMGIPDWLSRVRDRLGEAIGRAGDLPAYALSVVAAELRPKLNELVSLFIGDVFVYLATRGTATTPGTIPSRFLDKLHRALQSKRARGDEPLVVLSHSMGGQIVYDAVTSFLPAAPAFRDARIDFWCATASQVGFFEEAKLFLASEAAYKTGHEVPFPQSHLGMWWNVWDQNDFLSYTVKDIVSGVMDESFDSGMSLVEAHGGYVRRPSFFRVLAEKLRAAKAAGWR